MSCADDPIMALLYYARGYNTLNVCYFPHFVTNCMLRDDEIWKFGTARFAVGQMCSSKSHSGNG